MFNDNDIISCYTWDDAVNDGLFVNVSRMAQKAGFTLPVAITSNLLNTHIKAETEEQTDLRINTFLLLLSTHIKRLKTEGKANSDMLTYEAPFLNDTIEVWAKIEGRSPQNPEPVMTIMLPEDY